MAKISKEEYKELKALDDKWKWIARDENTHFVNIFEEKPYKDTPIWMWRRNSYVGRIESDMSLFQFIQWEDGEPHIIAELIEEYESEEIEVKKDKEWAQKEVDGYLCYEGVEAARNALAFAKGVIKQLDEPEVLSQEWIDSKKLRVSRRIPFHMDVEYAVPEEDLQNIIVPKQELPVIPQFVSSWIEETKKQSKSFVFAIAHIYDKNEIDESPSEKESRIFQWMELYDNDEVFARAWLDGYTIKKEPKYNVKFKVKSSFGTVGIYLYKKGDEVLAGDNFEVYYPKEDKYRLTEQEVRGFQNGDVLFEHFAVKAEEMEE